MKAIKTIFPKGKYLNCEVLRVFAADPAYIEFVTINSHDLNKIVEISNPYEVGDIVKANYLADKRYTLTTGNYTGTVTAVKPNGKIVLNDGYEVYWWCFELKHEPINREYINLYSRSNIFFSNLLNALRNLIVPNDRLQTQMIPSVITLKKIHKSIDFIIFIERP